MFYSNEVTIINIHSTKYERLLDILEKAHDRDFLKSVNATHSKTYVIRIVSYL